MNKLEVLKKYLQYVIDNKELHEWTALDSCHCGSLLMSLDLYTVYIIEDDNELDEVVFKQGLLDTISSSGFYRYVFQAYKEPTCNLTNLPFTTVLNKLLSYGFSLDELINLEHLQDKRFIDLDIQSSKVKEVDNLIIYLNNWINFEQQLVKSKNTDKVTVSI